MRWRRTPQPEPSRPRQVGISGEVIRLGQLLKLADLVETGAEAKDAIAAREVSVNGEVESRRGRQLRRGDVVTRLGREPVQVGDTGDTTEHDVAW